VSEELNQQLQREFVARSLSEALAGQPLRPGVAAELSQSWRSDFRPVIGPDGKTVLVDHGGRPASEVIAARLAEPANLGLLDGRTQQLAQLKQSVDRVRGTATGAIGLSAFGR
jgi:hypothetical protein